MSTESEQVHASSDAVDGSNASRFEVEKDQMSETLADPCQAGELVAKRDGDEQEGCDSLASAGDHGMEKRNGFTDLEKQNESLNVGSDLDIGTENVDVETNERKKKVPVDSEEVLMGKGEKTLCDKDSDGIQTELMVEKEVEPDTVCSHDVDLSDVKHSDISLDTEDLGEVRKPGGSRKRDKAKNLSFEWDESISDKSISEESIPDESSSDDDNALITGKLKLSDSDLVWAKVRSHPWWPGQVFDTSAATDKAKKYFRKGSYLVTYFGDCSFAWNDPSRIKPFRQHFSQMAKQSTLPDFLDAIEFALEEVSRRIEFGLACSCISKEVYQQIKTQNIINPGVLEDSSRIYGGDRVSSAIFFKPANLVEYVKDLACSPNFDATDELQFVSRRAQLLAFNRWKGYTELPEFDILQGSVESAAKISPAEEKSSLSEMEVSVSEPKKAEQVYTKRRKTEVPDDCKQDAVFEYEDTSALVKKEQTLAEFIAEKRLSRSKGKRSHENSGIKSQCEKKRKVASPKSPKSTKMIKANLQTEDPGSPVTPKTDRKYNLSAGNKTTPDKARRSFGIGASILRVANQMHCSTPTRLIPCSNSTGNNGSRKGLKERPKAEELSKCEISSSPNEKLSNLHSASATNTPSGKPNSVSIDQQSGELEASSTNLVEGSMLGSRDLKDSSEEQILQEHRKEDAEIASEVAVKNSNGENIAGSDSKEQPDNSSGKEDSSAK